MKNQQNVIQRCQQQLQQQDLVGKEQEQTQTLVADNYLVLSSENYAGLVRRDPLFFFHKKGKITPEE